uniref:DUF1176 domain-containing protein n=1 Tax=Caulobacter sp. (strain K31) TaxID=366602 RepID=B0T3X6_CAUSK
MLLRLFRRPAAWLLALALISPSIVRAQSGAPYIDRELFDDWTLICDNGRRCTAVGLPTEATRGGLGADALLTIVRDPQVEAQPRVEIVIPYWEGPGSGGRWALADASGKPIIPPLSARFAPATHVLRIGLPPTSIDTLLGARREVALSAASGKPTIALSLLGMRSALTRLDEVQGRSGGVTATASKGPRPASELPAPPTLQVVRKAPRSRTTPPRLKPPAALVALSGQLSALDICSGMANGVPAETVWGPYQLDDKTLLWTIWCAPGGNKGFNQTDVPVLSALDGSALRLPAFEGDPTPATPRKIMRSRAKDETDLWVPTLTGFTFYDSTGVVEQSDISATIAESSGRFERYVWTGRLMVLFESSDVSVPTADGSSNAAPYFGVWPPNYRAIVKPAKTVRRPARPAAPPR